MSLHGTATIASGLLSRAFALSLVEAYTFHHSIFLIVSFVTQHTRFRTGTPTLHTVPRLGTATPHGLSCRLGLSTGCDIPIVNGRHHSLFLVCSTHTTWKSDYLQFQTGWHKTPTSIWIVRSTLDNISPSVAGRILTALVLVNQTSPEGKYWFTGMSVIMFESTLLPSMYPSNVSKLRKVILYNNKIPAYYSKLASHLECNNNVRNLPTIHDYIAVYFFSGPYIFVFNGIFVDTEIIFWVNSYIRNKFR